MIPLIFKDIPQIQRYSANTPGNQAQSYVFSFSTRYARAKNKGYPGSRESCRSSRSGQRTTSKADSPPRQDTLCGFPTRQPLQTCSSRPYRESYPPDMVSGQSNGIPKHPGPSGFPRCTNRTSCLPRHTGTLPHTPNGNNYARLARHRYGRRNKNGLYSP